MGDFRICLLHEYHRNRLLWEQQYECLIYGSLLDRETFEIAYKLYKMEHPSTLVIIFPVSKQWKPTQYYFAQFQKILIQEYTPMTLSHIIQKIQNEIMKYIVKTFPAKAEDQLQEEGCTAKEREYRNNIRIFGVLTAKYLRKIVQFPTIRMREQWYNGIPRNFTVEDFIRNIITFNANSTIFPTNSNQKTRI